jgi:hypothetical protein
MKERLTDMKHPIRTEEGGENSLPLPLTVREWLQADARILIKAAKAIAEMNEM